MCQPAEKQVRQCKIVLFYSENVGRDGSFVGLSGLSSFERERLLLALYSPHRIDRYSTNDTNRGEGGSAPYVVQPEKPNMLDIRFAEAVPSAEHLAGQLFPI